MENADYWEGLRSHPNRIRVDHVHYMLGPEPKDDSPISLRLCGCGGRKFVFGMLDGNETEGGTVRVSHNVWCQGDIPPELWDDPDFKDNATILK